MKRKTYPMVCEYCRGKGFVRVTGEGYTATSSLTEVCPVCNGNKTVTVIEDEL